MLMTKSILHMIPYEQLSFFIRREVLGSAPKVFYSPLNLNLSTNFQYTSICSLSRAKNLSSMINV